MEAWSTMEAHLMLHKKRFAGATKKTHKHQQKPSIKYKGVRSHTNLKSYLINHCHVANSSFKRLLKNPIASIMTWAVIGIAIILPMGLYILLANMNQLSQGWDRAVQISIFTKLEATEKQSLNLAKTLQQRPDIKQTQYISRHQALEEFKKSSGFRDAIDSLQSNPLPAVIIVYPTLENTELISKLLTELRSLPVVEHVQMDLEWLQRLYSIMSLGQRLIIIIGGLLAVAVLLVVGNTIRLAIEARREEIIIIKLVGATNAFVKRPFLYTGIWYGLGGGIIAAFLINLLLYWVAEPAYELIGLYKSEFQLAGMSFPTMIIMLFGSSLLGWVGAWVAVDRHINEIEPH